MSYLIRAKTEEDEYKKIIYPNTVVLINKLNIQDVNSLESLERQLTSQRASQGFPENAHCNDYEGFKAIHYHLFQDLYDWAGQV